MAKLLLLAIFFVIIREFFIAYAIEKKCSLYVQKHHLEISVPSLFFSLVKRFGDIVLSLAVCLTILPILYVVLGLIIKLTSEGPIIYKQQRKGLFGKSFTCYKFRSMYQNSGMEKVMRKDDARITKIGRFIRRTHLDEFPQFFNVLKGDMSTVGPRPLPEREIKKFAANSECFLRFLLRPGITGTAQVNSSRLLKPDEVLHFDVQYVCELSLIKDIKLIIQTLRFSDIAY